MIMSQHAPSPKQLVESQHTRMVTQSHTPDPTQHSPLHASSQVCAAPTDTRAPSTHNTTDPSGDSNTARRRVLPAVGKDAHAGIRDEASGDHVRIAGLDRRRTRGLRRCTPRRIPRDTRGQQGDGCYRRRARLTSRERGRPHQDRQP